jgi:hypothetical protein
MEETVNVPNFLDGAVAGVKFGGFDVDRFMCSQPNKLPWRGKTLPQAMIIAADKGDGRHLLTAFEWASMAYFWKAATTIDECPFDLHAETWQWVMGLFMNSSGELDVLASLDVSYAGSPYGRGVISGSGGKNLKLKCDGKGVAWLKSWKPGTFDGMSIYIAEAASGKGEFFPISKTSAQMLSLSPGATPGNGTATFCIVRHIAKDVTRKMSSGNRIKTLCETDADLKPFAIPESSNAQGNPDLGNDRFWFDKSGGLRAAIRGGYFNYDSYAGVFALYLNYSPSASNYFLGFRASKAL